MTAHAYYCELKHEGILSIQGPDASKFLQGQITCNLNYLNPEQSSLGARCTPKGRILSSFEVVAGENGYLLAMDKDLVEPQLADFKKYAVFSKVELSDASNTWRRIGVIHADAVLAELNLKPQNLRGSVIEADGVKSIRLDDARCELWIDATNTAFVDTLTTKLTQTDLNHWLLEQVRAGIGQVFATTRELFIPQMINLQAVGGVSFKKGCYTGQEIVARMQYLGKLKRRMYRFIAQVSEVVVPGTELFSPVHSSSVGEVVLSAITEDGLELLAVAQEDAVLDNQLHLQTLDGPALELKDLPYALDRDKEIQR